MKKSESKTSNPTDSGRRSFIWKTGAAVTAVMATAVPAMAMTRSGKDKDLKSEVDRLSCRLGTLEDENKIRELHRTYENHLDNGHYEKIVSLFSSNGEVRYNGGVFNGKEKGVRRLFCEHFSSGQTGKKITPAPGFEIAGELSHDKIEISKDGRTAKAQFSYSIQAGTPISSDSVLVKMARLQGGGVIQWWEGGLYKVSYVKEVKDGTWKIKRLEYQTMARADYKPGRSSARPLDIPLFTRVYPDAPTGPDKLL